MGHSLETKAPFSSTANKREPGYEARWDIYSYEGKLRLFVVVKYYASLIIMVSYSLSSIFDQVH